MLKRVVMAAALTAVMGSGCAIDKAPIEATPFQDGEGKADGAWTNVKFLGQLVMNQNLAAPYSKSPRYRSFSFTGRQASLVDIWVRSSTLDPVTYLLDQDWKVIAKNDDASDSDTSSHIAAQIPYNGTYWIVFRDYDLARGTFTVALGARQATGAKARAIEAYEAGISVTGTIEDVEVDAALLPRTVRAKYDEYAGMLESLYAIRFKDVRGVTVWGVAGSPGEEMWVVDLYTSSGTFLAHGYSGDYGPSITYWEPTEWDPTIPH